MNDKSPTWVSTLTHWGAYDLEVIDGRINAVRSAITDTDPSPIGQSIPGAVHHGSRITQPMARQGWLKRGPGAYGDGGAGGRGSEPFVPLSWDQAIDLAASELTRVSENHGNEAIFGGSYGWASAGRFHHAQSQIHRFLNCMGGYVRSVDSYSSAAGQVILQHVIGNQNFNRHTASWEIVAEASDLIVMFGGMPLRNAQIEAGGPTRHVLKDALSSCRERGVEFINIGPLRDDAAEFLDAEWLAPKPNTDTALMLALAHVLISEDRHDKAFLDTHCTGFETFRKYVMGEDVSSAKTPEWAAMICGLPAETIRNLARRMSAKRTYITMALSLQRAQHGEQPYWMAVTLAAMLGGIGIAGGGIGFGVGAFNSPGRVPGLFSGLSLPQGHNPVKSFIPVARIVDMLENPGGNFDYNGERHTYPDIRLIYWCGGNPFHHHQDLNRMIAAWQRPDTIIVHEPWWTATAKHADLVFPATTAYERNDIGHAFNDETVVAMKAAISPVGSARNDYDIFTGLAERLGIADSFTEGRDEMQWLRRLYDDFLQYAEEKGEAFPDFDTFWAEGRITLPMGGQVVPFSTFRDDPKAHPLATPSGQIEIVSETIASFNYIDCPAHPTWLEPDEWLGATAADNYPLHLVSPQPSTRLHSQLDCGAHSLADKIARREPVQIHPDDAAARYIADGDLVRVFNNRGACLAGARINDGVRPGVISLATGAWYDANGAGELERHGNPNVLTRDVGTSSLAQGTTAHTTLVEIERFDGPPPPMTAHDPPAQISFAFRKDLASA